MVTLTMAHMDCKLVDHSDSNIRALCNRCHLQWDNLQHRETRQRNLEQKRGEPKLAIDIPMKQNAKRGPKKRGRGGR